VDDDLPTRREYLAALAAETRHRPSIIDLSWAWLKPAAQAADWINRTIARRRLPLPGLLQPTSIAARCKPLRYSNARAKALLSWAPHWSFHEALDRSRAHN
jgi:nucleoside-diphosphate-sugar epimerase